MIIRCRVVGMWKIGWFRIRGILGEILEIVGEKNEEAGFEDKV